ncbi:MAG: excinuclease ABC subunit UvrA [Planctomycetes bacterium]|nr:excinuclease ABC subunit UvrA [Planctomycetota bacterium]
MRELDHILVSGARQHNLKNVTVRIPKKRLVVFTGVSGSGKSSLAFDTLYAEGQRRYVESLSSYARQFLGQMEKPLYDHIRGIAPTISVEQKASSKNPRSTVGTVTEIHDYLRVLFARVGRLRCWKCRQPIRPLTAQEIVQEIQRLPEGTRLSVLAPLAENRKGEYKAVFSELAAAGFARVRVNGALTPLDAPIPLDKKKKHTIELVVDRLAVGRAAGGRLAEAVETALRYGKGALRVVPEGRAEFLLSEHRTCSACGTSYPELSPQFFSFNSPLGMCPDCNGLGTKLEMDEAKLIVDPAKSVLDGAVSYWGRWEESGKGWERNIIRGVAKAKGIDLGTPWRKLPAEHRRILLHGTGGERVRVDWRHQHGAGSYAFRYEGLIPTLMRRMNQTHSEGMRKFYLGFMSDHPCGSCSGARLRPETEGVTIGGESLTSLCRLPIAKVNPFFRDLALEGNDKLIAEEVLKEVRNRLGFLLDVGLGYLSLDRLAPSLSGGESQRIRLASQIGSELTGVIYILDEPSIGLHQRDNAKLLSALQRLRDIGNSVIVVEHDRETMEAADHLVDFGPGAGLHGGQIVEEGPPAEVVARKRSLTAQYLCGQLSIPLPERRRAASAGALTILGPTENNLKGMDVRIPLGLFVGVTGVSGAGKSTLVNQILYPAVAARLHGADAQPGKHKGISGLEAIDKVVDIDQTPIGRTPRSNPATYTKLFDPIRDFFALLPESKVRGFKPGRFSFNVKGGRCDACQGDGYKTVEMHFLPDVYVPCEVCSGKRFNDATLEVRFQGKNIAEVLDLTVEEALALFARHPEIARILATLSEVGLGYIKLGQTSPTLSGGEAQRIKLSRELARRATGRTLYILDEPTTGLHFEDMRKLLQVLQRLVDTGNTVLVIEHNLDVIKACDWLIDLGPEGGAEGGEVIAEGTPEAVAANEKSYTGKYLRSYLAGEGSTEGAVAAAAETAAGATEAAATTDRRREAGPEAMPNKRSGRGAGGTISKRK